LVPKLGPRMYNRNNLAFGWWLSWDLHTKRFGDSSEYHLDRHSLFDWRFDRTIPSSLWANDIHQLTATRTWPLVMFPTGIGAPDCMKAPRNNPPESPLLVNIWREAEIPPADWPHLNERPRQLNPYKANMETNKVTRLLSPPKLPIYRLIHWSAARSNEERLNGNIKWTEERLTISKSNVSSICGLGFLTG